MQYNMKWLTYSDLDLVLKLSEIVYQNEKNTYPVNLKPASNYDKFTNIISVFLVSDDYLGSDQREVLGIFDKNENLVTAIGVRKILTTPSWVLSWTISNLKTITFIKVWQEALLFICDEMEKKSINEFFVVNPDKKEKVYEKLMRFLRDRYWTFVEFKIPAGKKISFSLYWSIMGHQLYNYDVNIRRYILKRDHDS